MRISDWSSDVCSSDLGPARPEVHSGIPDQPRPERAMGADFHRMATTANLDAQSLHDVVDARCCVHLKSPMGIQINRSVDVSGLCHTRPPRSAHFSLRAMFSLNKVMNCSNTPETGRAHV